MPTVVVIAVVMAVVVVRVLVLVLAIDIVLVAVVSIMDWTRATQLADLDKYVIRSNQGHRPSG